METIKDVKAWAKSVGITFYTEKLDVPFGAYPITVHGLKITDALGMSTSCEADFLENANEVRRWFESNCPREAVT